MSCYGDLIGRVGGGCFHHSRENASAGVDPRLPKTAVGCAVGADVSLSGSKVEVCTPGVDGMAASKGDDD